MNEKFPMALPEGTILAGQYIIEAALGQGGFGITYRATDHKTGEKVAVKEYFPDSMVSRNDTTTVIPFTGEREDNFKYGMSCFLQEAETLAEFIGNENIVKIHSYFEENGTAYFVMDFIEGVSFDEYIKEKGGSISVEEAENTLLFIIDALAEVHRKGIVHRDVTPDNIYITKDGKVKLLDFGAARYSIGDKSRSLDIVLKHGFAPKEQYTRRGKQGPFTDVYTVGASFYFAITGKRPPDSIDRLENDELVPPSALGVAISPAKEDAILKAMAVQPGDRYQSMEEFHAALMGTSNAGAVANNGVQQRFFGTPDSIGNSVTNTVGVTQNGAVGVTQNGVVGVTQMGAVGATNGQFAQQPVMQANNTYPVNNGNVQNQFYGAPNGYAMPKKSKKGLIIGLSVGGAALLVIIVGIIIGVVVAGNNAKKNSVNYSPESAAYAYWSSLVYANIDTAVEMTPDVAISYYGGEDRFRRKWASNCEDWADAFEDCTYEIDYVRTKDVDLDLIEDREEFFNDYFDSRVVFLDGKDVVLTLTIFDEDGEELYSDNTDVYVFNIEGKWYAPWYE